MSVVLDSPDAPAVIPVAGHAGARQQRRHGLVKQEVVGDQLLLLGVGHAVQGVVLALELALQGGQGCGSGTMLAFELALVFALGVSTFLSTCTSICLSAGVTETATRRQLG